MAEARVRHIDDVLLDRLQASIASRAAPCTPGGEVLGDHVETAINSGRSSLPASVRRFNVTPSFSTLWLLKVLRSRVPRRSSTKGETRAEHPRSRRVTGSSIRMTSAPMAARNRVAPAPASCPEKSQMRSPPKASLDVPEALRFRPRRQSYPQKILSAFLRVNHGIASSLIPQAGSSRRIRSKDRSG